MSDMPLKFGGVGSNALFELLEAQNKHIPDVMFSAYVEQVVDQKTKKGGFF